ncbi:hypothetical protein IL306_006081 [Fusarium sp. DS 682]|nr:hypothetical protein IL306_006081 [Fusarium sp. DS 682]
MKIPTADLATRFNRRVATSFIGRFFRLEEVRRDLVTATSAIAGLASLVFGLFTNLPIALAPGMGLNAYFAFQVVGYNGSGSIPYGVALTAVFTEGLIFVFLALTGMRQWLVKLIPSTIKSATGAGIGLFLTEIGLSYGTGIGAITGGWNATPLAIAGCPVDMINPETQMCEGGTMTSPKASRDFDRLRALLTKLTAMDSDIRRWLTHYISHGFPGQICLHHRNRTGFYPLVAVSQPKTSLMKGVL